MPRESEIRFTVKLDEKGEEIIIEPMLPWI
jgi:hypothetical protein